MFEVTTAGTSSGSEPAWNATVGGTTVDSGGVVWTTRGAAGVWLASKAYALGDRVVRVTRSPPTIANSMVWKCTTAGTSAGSEPSWPTTVTSGSTTQTDNTVTWTAVACKTWDDANPFLDCLLKDQTNSTIKVGAGDSIYVSKKHSETGTLSSFNNMDIKLPGTAASPNLLLCVDDTGAPSSPTTLATTANIEVGSSSSFVAIYLNGNGYVYGITFDNKSTSQCNIICGGDTASSGIILDNCPLKLSGNVAGGRIWLGTVTSGLQRSVVTWNNVQLSFANAGQALQPIGCKFVWKNTPSGALNGTTVTGGLFDMNSGKPGAGTYFIDGVDLSGLGSNPIFNSVYYPASSYFKFTNCKLNASYVLLTPSTSNIGLGTLLVDMINCDSGGTNYKVHRDHGEGQIDHELTKIMTSGASDGTTGIAWKMVSNANAVFVSPLDSFPIGTWNDNSGSSKTATVEILTDSSSALNNDDVWLEIVYAKNSGDNLSGYGSNAKSDVLQSNAAQTTSTATWTTSGITHVMKQKLQVAFTPQQKGPVIGIVRLAKPSTTIYVNPQLSIS